MNSKKLTLILSGIVVAVLAAVFVYFYVQFNQVSTLSSQIPKDAEKVVYLNTKTLLKMFIKNRNDTTFKGFDSPYKDYFKNIKDPKNNGIDFLKDAVYIENNNRKYVLMMLNNEAIFSKNIAEVDANLFSKIETFKNYQKVFSIRDSFTICWTKNLVCFLPKQSEVFLEENLNEIFETKKENFSRASFFQNIQKPDALIWFYQKNANYKINDIETLKGYINYQDSIVIFATNNIENHYKDSTFLLENLTLKNAIYINSGNDFLNENFKKWAKILLPNQYPEIEKLDLKSAQKLLRTGDKKTIENKIITYEYDDEFNKQKIEKINYDTINELFLNVKNNETNAEMMFSNSTKKDFEWNKIPSETNIYIEMNDDFFGRILPISSKFNFSFIHQKQNKINTYQIIIKSKNIKQLFENLPK